MKYSPRVENNLFWQKIISFDMKKPVEHAMSSEILVQSCPSRPNQQNLTYLGRYSQDLLQSFENRLLRWNCESVLVDLNTMNSTIRTIFFSLIKVRAILSAYAMYLNMHKSFSNLLIEFAISKSTDLQLSKLFGEQLGFWPTLLNICRTHCIFIL